VTTRSKARLAESSSFLKKRTKKLLQNSASAYPGQAEAKMIKSFLLLFFQKRRPSWADLHIASWHRPHPDPSPRGGGRTWAVAFFENKTQKTFDYAGLAFPDRASLVSRHGGFDRLQISAALP
jgi:hypothetical protein